MRTAFAISALAALTLLAGCSASPLKPSRDSSHRSVEITTLRVRGGFVEIRTGPEGRSFSVLDDQGRTLAADVSATDLMERFPSHFEVVEASLATDASGPDVWSDAAF